MRPWCLWTRTALSRHWSFLSPLHCSFPEADIHPLAQHFDLLDGGCAGQSAISLRLRQWLLWRMQDFLWRSGLSTEA
jgi:hypothetical protein